MFRSTNEPGMPSEAISITGALDPRALMTLVADKPEAPYAERVLQSVERHVQAETESVALYKQLAEQNPDPVVRLLMRLVSEDEDRHHALFQRMAQTLSDDLNWTSSANALPPSYERHHGTPDEIAEMARLAEDEQVGVTQMRSLARKMGTLHDGLFKLLLDMMALDSEKHALVLRYIQRRLASD